MSGLTSWGGCAIVCLGTLMPWASAEITTSFRRGNISGSYTRSPVQMSGLKSTASFFGIKLPGVFVPVAAVAVAFMTSKSVGKPVCIGLTVYGFIHVLFMAIALSNTPNMDPQFGLVIAMVGLVVTFISIFVRKSPDNLVAPSTISAGL